MHGPDSMCSSLASALYIYTLGTCTGCRVTCLTIMALGNFLPQTLPSEKGLCHGNAMVSTEYPAEEEDDHFGIPDRKDMGDQNFWEDVEPQEPVGKSRRQSLTTTADADDAAKEPQGLLRIGLYINKGCRGIRANTINFVLGFVLLLIYLLAFAILLTAK
ncbi:hypothetical protein FE257_001586 [Aspergillus nanangensis]|uniref:Uncharacterized protein n=1 Tax=Aspergillus nanangensis TaxID=2582783 RepID=A0AAD4CU22_ASPNN|nr:hypothetical protein FE257_001586 [Aspergillus nanangensis]